MPRPKGYRTYRGASRRLGGLLIALILLLVFAGGTVLVLQRYLVYSADGVSLDLPFLRGRPQPEQPAEPMPPPVILEEEPEPEPPSRRGILGTLRAVTMTPEAMWAESVPSLSAQLAPFPGANAWLMQMKTEKGTLLWPSPSETAISASAAAPEGSLTVAVEETDEMFWRIARISCFRDDLASRIDRMPRLQTADALRWYDRDFLGWINPYSEAAQDYILSLAVELAEMGFDEILLEHFGFPVRGRMELLYYGTTIPFPQAVDAFLARMADALTPYDVTLSVITDTETVLRGENKVSGHTLDALASRADRIFVPCTAEEYPPLLAAAMEAGFKPDSVVMITDTVPEGLDCSWLLLK